MSAVDVDEKLAALLGFALAGRPERFAEAALAAHAPELRSELGPTYDALAALALAAAPIAPSAALRDRVLATVTAKRAAAAPKKALVVLDMINDHLAPGRPLEVPRARDVVPAIARRLDEARAAGIPVVYVVDEHEADDDDFEEWGAHAIKGSEGAEVWAELAPKAGDRVVAKPTYSAFSRSTLDAVLEELAVDTLVLTGCLTELGILATAKDALERGFAVEVPRDAQAGATAENEAMALGIVGVMPPFGPARKALLARTAAAHAG